jgi:TraM recognition site of TraD and TraG/Type IV secretion-system coupling protein DNA-binding domain
MTKNEPQIFLGLDQHERFVVAIPRELLRGHLWLVGATGAGKTVAIISLLKQLLRTSQVGPSPPKPPPTVIFDAKGDMAALQTARLCAQANGQAFRVFTLEQGRETNHFVPFESLQTTWRTPIELALLVLEGIGMQYGSGYGKNYYSSISVTTLLRAIKDPAQPKTLADLRRIIARLQRGPHLKDCLELLTQIETLSEYPQLQPNRDRPEQTISFPQVLEQREVVYFWLPATGSKTAQEVARLALYALFTAAQDRQRQNLAPREMYTIIDECQRILAHNTDVILQQARSAGIALILANQSLQDLKTRDNDARSVIRTNTRVQMFLTTTETEARFLSEMSGEDIVLMRSSGTAQTSFRGRRQTSTTDQQMEVFRKRLTLEDILRLSSDPQGMILHVAMDQGAVRYGGRPIAVRTLYPLSKAEYEARATAPWPALRAAPVTPAQETEPHPPREAGEPRASAAVSAPEEPPSDEDPGADTTPVAARMDALIRAELDAMQRLFG